MISPRGQVYQLFRKNQYQSWKILIPKQFKIIRYNLQWNSIKSSTKKCLKSSSKREESSKRVPNGIQNILESLIIENQDAANSPVFGSRMMRRWWSAISPQLGRSALDIPPPPTLSPRLLPSCPHLPFHPFLLRTRFSPSLLLLHRSRSSSLPLPSPHSFLSSSCS